MPPEEAYVSCPLPTLESPRQIIRYRKSRASILTSTQPRGVLQALDLARLTSVARKANCVLRVLPKTGDYISAGSAVVEVYGHAPLNPRHVLASFALGAERTLLQDPAYGLRGLVDVALQALSPAVNAPTTASQAICRLKELLLDIVERPIPTGYFADTDGVVRLVCPTTGWAEYVDLAFSEIIEFGISSSQIRRELSNTFAEMLEKLPVELQAPLARLSDKLRHAAEMVP